MTRRERIYNKFDGKCAYSGTPLEDDWQIDHIEPLIRNWWNNTSCFPDADKESNMFPCQKLINHYKHSMTLEFFRQNYLSHLHERLQKLPKNPRTKKSKKRKDYILKVASYFDITPDKPFNGIFYFETIQK